MKVCYFIQSHKNPKQIYRLVQTIKKLSPNAQILIGHDFKNCYLDLAPLQHLSDIHLFRLIRPGIRGDFSLIAPYLQAIDWLFTHNLDFEWLIYLSGQDYPTQPLTQVEKFLATTDYDGFVNYFDVFSSQSLWTKEEAIKRYFCQYYRLPNWTGKILSKVLKIQQFTPLIISIYYGCLIGLPAKQTPFSHNFLCYGGSQWHTLSRKCIEYIRDFIKNNSNFVSYYQKTLVPDESFIQTILINNQNLRLCNDNKRYLDFTGTNRGHARILTSQDYETMTNGRFHFARKFEQDTRILDMLEAYMFASSPRL